MLTNELWVFGGHGMSSLSAGYLNDLWKLQLDFTLVCPPFYQLLNNVCIPCLSDNNTDAGCTLQCDNELMNFTSLQQSELPSCLIEGNITVNSSIVEANTITIVGVLNVTGNVIVTENATLKLSPGATLHVGQCLVLDDNSRVVVVVNETVNSNGSVLATYDAQCSTPQLIQRVSIDSVVDECEYGRPSVTQLEEGGRVRLELLFFSIDSNQCNLGDDNDTEHSGINVVAVAVSVSVVVGVILIVTIVILATRRTRRSIFPFKYTD